MKQEIEGLRESFRSDLAKAREERELEATRVKYLGRKGLLTLILKKISDLPLDQKKEIGSLANSLKKEITALLNKKKKDLESLKVSNLQKEAIDITAPGSKFPLGHLHPVTQVFDDIIEIFKRLGFSVAEGPEVESDWYNFQALNFPKDHPARDTQDTLFVSEEIVLRTQTSPVQIRYMEENKPPIRVVAPGRTYRRDSDVTHTPMFHQLEGLAVSTDIRFSDLKGTLEYFVHEFFGSERKLRFRPHFFPFTEPSAEVDISCGICNSKGCRVCKFSGWIEVLGAGMVHPQVLKNGGIDPKVYRGFAFGLGIERLAMLKYNIDDLRLFFENDLRFLKQF
ncbi:MAG: phenylalanine--tRNA ligase subunit alpha [Patescibacteria group bacterium]|nr:phenylalanine--tRNA ligase subunit alpha [Patescibacteria group bacterium]